jgi:hypothetical protein
MLSLEGHSFRLGLKKYPKKENPFQKYQKNIEKIISEIIVY